MLIMALSLGASAKTTGKENDKNKLSKKIQSVLSAPNVIKNKNKNEKVTVYFCVNADGNVIEVNAKTSDKEIKQHLEKEFMTLTLPGLKPCVTNTIDVNYVIY